MLKNIFYFAAVACLSHTANADCLKNKMAYAYQEANINSVPFDLPTRMVITETPEGDLGSTDNDCTDLRYMAGVYKLISSTSSRCSNNLTISTDTDKRLLILTLDGLKQFTLFAIDAVPFLVQVSFSNQDKEWFTVNTTSTASSVTESWYTDASISPLTGYTKVSKVGNAIEFKQLILGESPLDAIRCQYQ